MLDNNPTLTRRNTLQRYLNSVCKIGEITKSEYDNSKKIQKQQGRIVCQKFVKISQILNLDQL